MVKPTKGGRRRPRRDDAGDAPERHRRGRDRGDISSPTHYLKMKSTDRDGAGWNRVGVAWERDNGLLSVKLNRGTILDWHDFCEGGNFSLIIVPADD